MEWSDVGYIISQRKHGESSAIIGALTENHGRWVGYVRGGSTSKKFRGVLILGNLTRLNWKARLEEHLGSYSVELETANTVQLMDEALSLDGLNAICSLAQSLPERQNAKRIFIYFGTVIKSMCLKTGWLSDFARFELLLLEEFGYGLSAAQKEDLPPFLKDESKKANHQDLLKALTISGNFLEKYRYKPFGLPLPFARQKLWQKLQQNLISK